MIAPFGAVPFGILSEPEIPGVDLVLPIEIDVPSIDVYLPIAITAPVDREFVLPIEIDVPSVDIVLPIDLQLGLAVDLVLPIEIQAVDTTGWPLDSEQQSWKVFIDGVDYSSRLTGYRRIRQAINESGTAEFSLALDSGPVDDMSFKDSIVRINVVSGSNESSRYIGIVEDGTYNDKQGVMHLSCTTNLQGRYENANRETIAAEIGGHYSEHIFNDESDGWTYAEDRLSTQFACLVQDLNGLPQVVSLTPKVTPDFTFTEANIIKGSLSATKRTNRSELLNRVRLAMSYRYTKLRQRHIDVVFEHSMISGNARRLDFCDYLTNPYELCERSQIESAITRNAWKLLGDIGYEELPPSREFHCLNSGPRVWLCPDSLRDSTCLSARFTMARRWSQDVTENYLYDIIAPNSIDHAGEAGLDMSFAVENRFDANDWNTDEDYDGTDPDAVKESSTGDFVINITDGEGSRAEFDNATLTALHYVDSEMKRSHQANEREFTVPFNPDIKPGKTGYLNVSTLSGTVSVKGIIKSVEDESEGRGGIKSRVTLLFSAHGGSGIVSQSTLEPAALPEFTESPEVINNILIGYHMGAESTSQPEDETWHGYFTNRSNFLSYPYIQYDNKFKLIMPAIDDAFRQSIEATRTQIVKVDIETDPLTMTVG